MEPAPSHRLRSFACVLSVVTCSFCSLPQKDWSGRRTPEEARQLTRGLEVWPSLFASLTGTTVLQQRAVSPYADSGYSTPYEERGWCFIESSLARFADVSFARFEIGLQRQARPIQKQTRPKLIDISLGFPTGMPQQAEHSSTASPHVVLADAAAQLNRLYFTGEHDKQACLMILFNFEWMVCAAADTAFTLDRPRVSDVALTSRRRRPATLVASTNEEPALGDGGSSSSAGARQGSARTAGGRRGSAPAGTVRRGTGTGPSSTSRGSSSTRRGSAPPSTHHVSQAVSHQPQEIGAHRGQSGVDLECVQLVVTPNATELLTGTRDTHGRKMSAGYI